MPDNIDRANLGRVFSYLASSEGEQALDTLAEGLDTFRRELPVELNDAEFKYLSAALASQRSNDFTGDGIHMRTVSSAVNLRHGFVIKAKI